MTRMVPPRSGEGRRATALVRTGTDATAPALAGAAALILGGAVLHRRFRPGAER
ncbi:LPXTG cell wall anchor domain-containing protein [Streptomyces sp. NPDC048737]|uniref:LPXTG cell wall anchor domain-containing protein n=1 Tax=unclassified Streptomyces TaxID=2593676 RepID=UPI0034128F74